MRGRKKGGLRAPAATILPTPDSLPACAAAFLEHLAARAYSQGSLDAHHWALKGFLAWAGEQNLTAPGAFTRATLGDYQLHFYHKHVLLARIPVERLRHFTHFTTCPRHTPLPNN